MVPRDSDLLKHILLFSQALRSRKIGVTVDNIISALKGIPLVDIQKKKDFYYLLRCSFVSRKEEIEPFDELFELFWSFEDKGSLSVTKMVKETDAIDEEKEENLLLEFFKEDQTDLEDWTNEAEKDESEEPKDLRGYSPEEILGRKDFSHLNKAEANIIKEFVLILCRKMALNLSRRWKKGKGGDQLDFRRSMRQSVKYGGELLELRMKQRKQKPLRLLLVCDVSGSMDIYIQFFLLFMYGLQNHYPHCQTFAFSTRLSHITSLLKRRTLVEALRLLSEKVVDWSGGTNIGSALHQLHQRHDYLLHPSQTLFLIFSDGWDRGDTKLLDSEMRYLRKQVKKIIWLNPLLGSRSYQPLCKGMATALRYLDYFLPCYNFLSLKNLGRLISKT